MAKSKIATNMVVINFKDQKEVVKFLFNKNEFEKFEKQISQCDTSIEIIKCKTADDCSVFINLNKVRDMYFLFEPMGIENDEYDDDEDMPYREVLLTDMEEPKTIMSEESDNLYEAYMALQNIVDNMPRDDIKFVGIPDIDGETFYYNLQELLYLKTEANATKDIEKVFTEVI